MKNRVMSALAMLLFLLCLGYGAYQENELNVLEEEIVSVEVQRRSPYLSESEVDSEDLMKQLSREIKATDFIEQDERKAEVKDKSGQPDIVFHIYGEEGSILYTLEITNNLEQVTMNINQKNYFYDNEKLDRIFEEIFSEAQEKRKKEEIIPL